MSKILDQELFAQTARRSVAEGIVLLKNDNQVLPLKEGSRIALFGRSQYNYYKSGTGSGGLVNTKYVIGVKEAIAADSRYSLNDYLVETYDNWIQDHPFDMGVGWAAEPWFQEEMPITEEIAKKAAQSSDLAILLIGRTAGEDKDNFDKPGSYLLTEDEKNMLAQIRKAFDKLVVLINAGNIIDMKWVQDYKPDAVAYIWQGGQEGGNGVIDVLSGDVCPSGRLADTIAYDITDYPSTENFGDKKRNIFKEDIYVGYRYFETFAKDKVLYPFGFGLSYTDFEIVEANLEALKIGAEISATVKNVGKVKGQQTVQVYAAKPQGKLGNPARILVAFAKTKELEPGESQQLIMDVPEYYLASFDDSGVTGHKNAYVLEPGTCTFYVGFDVRAEMIAGEYVQEELKVLKEHREAMTPVTPFSRMKPKADGKGGFVVDYEPVPLATVRPKDHRDAAIPAEIPQTGDKGLKLKDVRDGKCTMEEFIGQLSDEDLITIVRGEGMSSPKVTPGCGGAFGGVTDSLLSYGIPVACCTDGPSGIRMDSGRKAFAMPNGACLASTWNLPLQEKLYNFEGLELKKNKIDVLLGPGMNLHRNPLNGRNFEYFSEDPVLTGKCAAAQLKGMHKYGVTGTIKHFAMNVQELARHTSEQVASGRAIREVYLKSFEIAVKEGNAHAVMTSYGPINGVHTAANYDLNTVILREEWGFDGLVMTDWWAKGCEQDQPGQVSNMASIIRAQNDLYMVANNAKKNSNSDNSEESLKNGTVTRGEYQRSAGTICKFIMNKPVFTWYLDEATEEDKALVAEADEEDIPYDILMDCQIDDSGKGIIDTKKLLTARNKSNMITVGINERGNYRLSMRVRANTNSELAQIPLTIYKDKELIKTITLAGTDTDWQDIDVDIEGCFASFCLNLYFSQDGMEFEKMEVTMTKSMEEEIIKMLARMGE
ncbi:MAG: glycoside hydrolase family 3 C-terminal domain-containing protein [Pseudobutyrivibrio sp.]|nr:glycoside hydrolase family 3 C-terminal domain-containing protein [Pseudobutyrivibrio sp.]